MRVSVNVLPGNTNARTLLDAMSKGIAACGDSPVMRSDKDHSMAGFSAAVLWGFVESCQRVIQSCKDQGIPWVFLDNGYMLRDTHFKVSVNDRHPTSYVRDLQCPADRFEKWNHPIKPWQQSNGPSAPIIVAGMSAKAAWSWGMTFEVWERRAIDRLQQHTKRKLIYRPKSNSPQAQSIPGTSMDRTTPIWKLLDGAHAVVTYHSNVACDALYEGVPVFCHTGAARPLAIGDGVGLDLIEAPFYPEGRQQWAQNLAYCNWSADEMRSGECWRFMKFLFLQGV